MSQYTIKLEQFEGPLDLLLKLIEKQELDISRISLAGVTEQYIEYVSGYENEFSPDELADFLVMAARLLLIKSRGLLPQMEFDEENSPEELEKQLKMYKAFLEASQGIEKILAKKKFGFFREKLPKDLQGIFTPPKNADGNILAMVFKDIMAGLELAPKLKEKGIERIISIKEKIDQISNLIFQEAELDFDELTGHAKDRVEMIVSFLAILELVKQGRAMVKQMDRFGEIRVCGTRNVNQGIDA